MIPSHISYHLHIGFNASVLTWHSWQNTSPCKSFLAVVNYLLDLSHLTLTIQISMYDDTIYTTYSIASNYGWSGIYAPGLV